MPGGGGGGQLEMAGVASSCTTHFNRFITSPDRLWRHPGGPRVPEGAGRTWFAAEGASGRPCRTQSRGEALLQRSEAAAAPAAPPLRKLPPPRAHSAPRRPRRRLDDEEQDSDQEEQPKVRPLSPAVCRRRSRLPGGCRLLPRPLPEALLLPCALCTAQARKVTPSKPRARKRNAAEAAADAGEASLLGAFLSAAWCRALILLDSNRLLLTA